MFSVITLIILTFIIFITGILIKIILSIKNKVLYLKNKTLLSGIACLVISLLILFIFSITPKKEFNND